MRPKAVITGATGYIGSHVVRYLLDHGWRIATIIREPSHLGYLEDLEHEIETFSYEGNILSLIDFFQCQKADVVMHLAAAVITNPSPEQASTIIDANVRFGTEILEAMAQSATRLFISTGSYWQNYDGKNEYNPVDLYSASKEAFEKIVKFYVEAYGFRHINLRLFDVYGEDDRRPKLWNTLKEIAGTDKLLDISAGEQLLDMVHVDDVARAYECAYEYLLENHDSRNEVFGVYSGNLRPLKEIVHLYERILNKKLKLNWGARPYKNREVMKPFDGYAKLPNWRQNIPVETGLTKFNNWGG